MELKYDAEQKLLNLYDSDGHPLLTLDIPCATRAEIYAQLRKFISEPIYKEDVLRSIEAFGQWLKRKEEPPEESQLLYIELSAAFLMLSADDPEIKIRLVDEFRSMAQFLCWIEIEHESQCYRIIHFWKKEKEKKEEKKKSYFRVRLHRLPNRSDDSGRKNSLSDLIFKERKMCHETCSKYLYNILKPTDPGSASHDQQAHCLDIVRSLPDFFRSVDPLSEEGRYLRTICQVMLELTNQFDILRVEVGLDLEREVRMFIVLSEESFGDRNQHLNDLLYRKQDYAQRKEDLWQFIDWSRQVGANISLVRQAGVLFTEYFLSLYDFESATEVLEQILSYRRREKKPGTHTQLSWIIAQINEAPTRLILWLALSLLKYARLSALLCLLFVILLMSPAVADATEILDQQVDYIVVNVASVGFVIFYTVLIFFPILILWRSARDRLPYYQLFFPRLFGAIVAGLAAIVFDQTPWTMGGKVPFMSLLVFSGLAILASKSYLQLDIHKLFNVAHGMDWKRASTTANRLFWIGLIQALMVATAVSSLLSSAVDFEAPIGTRLHLVVPLGIYPTIVIMWTGIALFLGAFLQLLWQGARITEPI